MKTFLMSIAIAWGGIFLGSDPEKTGKPEAGADQKLENAATQDLLSILNNKLRDLEVQRIERLLTFPEISHIVQELNEKNRIVKEQILALNKKVQDQELDGTSEALIDLAGEIRKKAFRAKRDGHLEKARIYWRAADQLEERLRHELDDPASSGPAEKEDGRKEPGISGLRTEIDHLRAEIQEIKEIILKSQEAKSKNKE